MESITYNTEKVGLGMPEYGRHIHNMVNFAKTITDDDERQSFAQYIIKLMLQMSPNAKGGSDFEEKMWVHLFLISNYELDVTPPNGIIPVKSEKLLTPERLPYPKRNREFRHYGLLVQAMVQKAIPMEEGPKKEEFKEIIGSFMKLAYKNWSREHYVNDEVIKLDLKKLSKGELIIPEEQGLNKISAANKPFFNKTNNNTSHRGKRKSYSKGGSNNRKNSNNNYRKKRY